MRMDPKNLHKRKGHLQRVFGVQLPPNTSTAVRNIFFHSQEHLRAEFGGSHMTKNATYK
jgi:hypothetical protein